MQSEFKWTQKNNGEAPFLIIGKPKMDRGQWSTHDSWVLTHLEYDKAYCKILGPGLMFIDFNDLFEYPTNFAAGNCNAQGIADSKFHSIAICQLIRPLK